MQKRFGEAAFNAAQSEMLLPEERGFIEVEGMERTYKITQEQLKKDVDITTAQKVIINPLHFTALPFIDVRASVLNFPNSGRTYLTTHATDDTSSSEVGRDTLLQWTGEKAACNANCNSARLCVLSSGSKMNPSLQSHKRSMYTYMTEREPKFTVYGNISRSRRWSSCHTTFSSPLSYQSFYNLH
jgi:hypothetical protein